MTAVLQRLPVTLVDAFARRPGEGNRAAVLVVADRPAGRPMPDEQLAALARELAEPVTVFAVADGGGPGQAALVRARPASCRPAGTARWRPRTCC